MLASGFLSPIESARAKLQEQIGLFLSGRAKLIRLMENPNLQIQGQARGLYAVQQQLETQLQNEIYPKIQEVTAGVWDMSDVINLTWFTTTLMGQISEVSKLERQAGGTASVMDNIGFGIPTLAMGGGVLLVLGIMAGVFSGRRA